MKFAKSFSFLFMSLWLGFALSPAVSKAYEVPAVSAENSTVDVAGTWKGPWKAPDGYVYMAELHLTVDTDHHVSGDIHWTLKASPRAKEKSKTGMTGTEYVEGTFYPDSRALDFAGNRLDDPHHILGTDIYRLRVSDDGKALGGLTSDHGRWDATFILSR